MTNIDKKRMDIEYWLWQELRATAKLTGNNAEALKDTIMNYLHSQGVVIKVDRESAYEYMCGARIKDILKRGYVAVEPLIGGNDE